MTTGTSAAVTFYFFAPILLGRLDTVTRSSRIIFILPGSQKEKRENGPENIFGEIMAENFPNLGKQIDIKIQEAQEFQIR